jgi:hypothetical protein
MQRSESIAILAKALVLAKGEMKAPKKDKTAKITESRSYSYADLASVKESYQEAIGKHKMFVTHALAPVDGHVVLTTTLVHECGEWISSDYPIPSYPKPQEMGSALTYFKRYNVCALLDIVAEDDDDGAAAQAGTAKAVEKKLEPKAAPKPSALSREEIEAVHALAKKAGLTTLPEFSSFLKKLCNVDRAADLSKSELAAVLDTLGSMAAQKVPA